jgi:hypothetical protein
MHKVTFDDSVVYTVGGFPLPTDGSYKFVQPPGPTCPTKAFEVLETRLGDRQQPVGTALAVVVACSQNTEECPLQIAYNGRIWSPYDAGTVQPPAVSLLASEVDGLKSATLWSTTEEDRLMLRATESATPIGLQPLP